MIGKGRNGLSVCTIGEFILSEGEKNLFFGGATYV